MRLSGKIEFTYNEIPGCLKSLEPVDITTPYLDGLNRENRFLETKPDVVTLQSQTKYINSILQDDDKAIFGLWCSGELAGTSGAQHLAPGGESSPTIGIFFFHERYRGQGWGKVLLWAMLRQLFDELRIGTIRGSVKKENTPSIKSCSRVGIKIVAQSESHYCVEASPGELVQPQGVLLIPADHSVPRG